MAYPATPASAFRWGMLNPHILAGIMWAMVAVAPTTTYAQPGASSGGEPNRRAARPDPTAAAGAAPRGGKAKVFDFTGLELSGRLRAPQLLYFLERANEELERASLERRSFIPEMLRTLDEESL